MGICQYRYSPSEQYQRTRPGMAPESCCGAPTYHLADEPEMALVSVRYGDEVVDEWHPTGRMVPRAHPDPYCPAHGGTPEPPPPPVSMSDLELAHAQYLELAQRFQEQTGGAITAAVPEPAALAAPTEFDRVAAQADVSALEPPVTAEDVQAAAANYAALAAGQQGGQ